MNRLSEQKFLSIRLDVTGFDKDRLTGYLSLNRCSGIEEISQTVWQVYFNREDASDRLPELSEGLRRLNPEFRESGWTVSYPENRDWNAEWKKHFRPFRVGSRVWVAPPWELPPVKDGEELIIIEPQMAFGTGHHATTRLLIRAVDSLVQPGQRVLDAGTGSGILAILAHRRGAAEILAFDIEADAIENARHNAILNKTDGIRFLEGNLSVVPDQSFDVVLANINLNTLQQMMSGLVERVKPDGLLILSGLLENDQSAILKEIPPSLQLQDRWQEKEWIALLFKKMNSFPLGERQT